MDFTWTSKIGGAPMKFAWQFNKVNQRLKNREATQGEFFSNDTELRGFVREAVQNSLDAKRSRVKGPVRVRIFISGEDAALQTDQIDRYFGSGWQHFCAKGSGLRNAPDSSERCRFIVYEDSGTTGLTGDPSQYHEITGVRNPFYYFFRAEGQSSKTDGGRGRWGLGKFVFPRSSRIRTFFGVTVRHDDRKRLLVGQSILRSHQVKGRSFTPDGWFGDKHERSETPLPVSDQRFINKFLRDFQVSRGDDPGLSIVVPYCDDAWTLDALRDAVVQDFFYPVLRGDLVVTLEAPGAKWVVTAESIAAAVDLCSATIRETLRPLVRLAQWSLKDEVQATFVELPCNQSMQGVTTRSLPDGCVTAIRNQMQIAGKVAFRVPLEIDLDHGRRTIAEFEVFAESCEGSMQKRPLFIRDGIVISDVRTRPIRDMNLMVSITDRSLSTLLGDAENPAHTEWSEESSHFKGKYTNGSQIIRRVRNLPGELCQLLAETDADDDPVLLLNVFSLGTSIPGQGVPVSFAAMTSRGSKPARPFPASRMPQRTTKPYRTTSRKGGFRIASRSHGRLVAPPIEVAVAYDRRSGSALRNFRLTDFHLSSEPIQISVTNAIVEHLDANRILITPRRADFEVTVTGFDVNRDLFLKTSLHGQSQFGTRRVA
ncbi:MAG: hypothetical protein ACK58L_11945 [Planctomycetota bacterium]